MPLKLVTIVGARPQFIKAAAFSYHAASDDEVEEVIVHTGQHFDNNMSGIFFKELGIPEPKYNLNINGGSHGKMTGNMIIRIEEVLIEERPDILILYGDTNSTVAGALAASKLNIPIAHIEAGLRSFNLKMPEEINRILTDRISNFLYCPTDEAIANLENEGFKNFNVRVLKTGDIMYDSTLLFDRLVNKSPLITKWFGINRYVVCTIHRQESTNNLENLKSIFAALEIINETIPVVIPIHPRTASILKEYNIESSCRLIDPVSYLEMINLVKYSSMVLTDSGGLQKEAYFLKKHCVVLREETEWNELIQAGYNAISGYSIDDILNSFENLKKRNLSFRDSFYGNGDASMKILSDLKAHAK